MHHISKSEHETAEIAQSVLSTLANPQQPLATVLALHGDLGSGKTTFTKALAKHLGITETIVSPTFVIAKFYDIPENTKSAFPWGKLIHIDAYRLESGEDLRKLDFEREFQNPETIIVIEWPEQVKDLIPAHAERLYFRFVDEHTREIITP